MNAYEVITDRIIKQLDNGIVPWQRPWSLSGEGGCINYVTRKEYSFLNQMLLGEDGEYLTFKQCTQLGGKIKKGAKSKIVAFFTMCNPTKKDNEDLSIVDEAKSFPILKYYNVFHIKDCEGIESKIKPTEANEDLKPIDNAENVINDYIGRESGLEFESKVSSKAYYSPAEDKVVVPTYSQYKNIEEYYSTTFHELVHSTGHKNRCNRGHDSIVMFADKNYAKEELVAEIGSAMLCSNCNIDGGKAFNNSVAYIQGWLKKLRNDPKMIVWASRRAEAAAKYILNIKEEK